jgi:RNA polymerase sigma-70 factor (ECF subfamily)
VDERVARWSEQPVASDSELDLAGPQQIRLSALPDVDLMSRLRDGEQEALSHLFDRYHRLVLKVGSKLVRDPAEAEDLMQEVFFELYRFIDRFDPLKGTAKAWIVQLAYHKGLKRRKYLALRGAFEDRAIALFDPADTTYPSPGNNGHSSNEILEIIQKGLVTLTPKQREVIELVCLEGFLLREIADRSKEPVGNVRHHYYRGIEKLKDFVQRNLQPEKERRVAAQRGER